MAFFHSLIMYAHKGQVRLDGVTCFALYCNDSVVGFWGRKPAAGEKSFPAYRRLVLLLGWHSSDVLIAVFPPIFSSFCDPFLLFSAMGRLQYSRGLVLEGLANTLLSGV